MKKKLLDYFNQDSLAADVWENKYKMEGEETPDDMHKRLAKEFAKIRCEKTGEDYDKAYTEIYELFKDFKYIIPQGSIMYGLGRNLPISLSNCVVIPKLYDSYGGICYADQQLAQLMKRRCVGKGTIVHTLSRGVVRIEDLKIGDYVLSYNPVSGKDAFSKVNDIFSTYVEEKDRMIIRTNNGGDIRTSKKHPILRLSKNGWEYVKSSKIKLGDILKSPDVYENVSSKYSNYDDIAWWIGCHLGDGNSGPVKYGFRVRILSSSKEQVERYRDVHKRISGSNSKISKNPYERCDSDIWEYTSRISKNKELIDKYLDGQSGNKTKTCFIPSYINSYNLLSFVTGLFDADGYVHNSRAVISVTSKKLIQELNIRLQSLGISTKYSIYSNDRENESDTHRLTIYNNEVNDFIKRNSSVKERASKLSSIDFSKAYKISNKELNELLYSYKRFKENNKVENLLAANIKNVKKYKKIGLAAYKNFQKYDLSLPKYGDLFSRAEVTEISLDSSTEEYYDIEVDKVNNFYAGDSGLINIHNCGVGLDISTLRPDNTKVDNSAGTSTGAHSFMERFSNTTREVAQCIRGDQRVIEKGKGLIEIKDVEIGDQVWTRVGWVPVINTLKNEGKELFKLTTKRGFSVICSADHKISQGVDGLVKLKDLTIGDDINLILGEPVDKDYQKLKMVETPKVQGPTHKFPHVHSQLKVINQPEILDERLAYLLGFYFGDGHEGESQITVAVEHKRPDLLNRIVKYVYELTGYRCATRPGDGAVDRVCIGGKMFKLFLIENGLSKHLLRIPKLIFDSPSSVQMAFISGLFDADGYVSGKKKGYSFSTASNQLAEDYQLLLSANGIASRIHVERNRGDNWKDLYTVNVTGKYAQNRFVEKSYSIKVDESRFVAKRDNVLTPFTSKDKGIAYNNYSSIPDPSQKMSHSAYASYDMVDEGLLYVDTVESIESVGVDTTYDLSLAYEHLFWCEGVYVKNSGRRGALMISIDVRHPDVEEFVIKKKDLTKVTGANVSVLLRDDFMEAVRDDKDYILRFPVDAPLPKCDECDYEVWEYAGEYNKLYEFDGVHVKKIRAKELWNTIIECAHGTAEPGLMFLDKHWDRSPDSVYEEYKGHASNPCFPGYAEVLTIDGLRPISSIMRGDAVWTENGWRQVKNVFDNGIQEVHRYHTTAGHIDSTKTHKILDNGVKVEIENAEEIDLLQGPYIRNGKNPISPQLILDGLLVGNGSVHPSSKDKIYLTIDENDKDYFNSEVSELIKGRHAVKHNAYKVDTSLEVSDLPNLPDRVIPSKYMRMSYENTCSFLRGLFSANGSFIKSAKRVTLKTTNKTLVQQVITLLSSVGIKSYYTINKAKEVAFDNGTYLCKESYDVNITSDRDIFYNNIGFIQKYKQEALGEDLESSFLVKRRKSHTILGSEYLGDYRVYDLEIDDVAHTYWCQGFNVSNCSEIFMGNDTCRLIAVNLFSFVRSPFTENAHIDLDAVEEIYYKGMLLSDDLVDLEIGYMNNILKKIKEDPEPGSIKLVEKETWTQLRDMAEKGRRTGLGFTALGDMLAALSLKYDSKDAQDVIEKVMRRKMRGELRATIDMAKKYGPFSGWNPDLEFDVKGDVISGKNDFYQMLTEEFPEIVKEMLKFGRRNVSWSTVAPTGSLSILARTTSGIEPLFLPYYTRRKKVNPGDDKVRVDFVDQNGDSWMEYPVVHPKIETWWKTITNGVGKDFSEMTPDEIKTVFEESPWHNSTANDISWTERVKIQSIVQKYTTHSISSTINLPNDVSVDDVKEIYEKSWEDGLKGVTVYRDGCRTGVLVSDSEKKEEGFTSHNAPKRPPVLAADAYKVSVMGEKFGVFVGLMDDKPYEVFAMHGDDYKHDIRGQIEKRKRGIYAFTSNNFSVDNIASDEKMDNSEQALCRMISTSLRHGAEIKFVVEQLNKTTGSISSFSKAISRTLKRYIPDGEESTASCPECGGKVIFEEGCQRCISCGNTKCG